MNYCYISGSLVYSLLPFTREIKFCIYISHKIEALYTDDSLMPIDLLKFLSL